MPGSTSTIRDVDWQTYADVFPDRYVLPSQSDALISDELSKMGRGRALDVGGGVRGTHHLRRWAREYLLLDPFVRTDLPRIAWEDLRPRSFDAAVARGSLNYLDLAQIGLIASCVREGGLLAFNTFLRPSEGERRYTSRSGPGTERYRPVSGGPFGMVEHVLEPDSGDPVVHRFHWYPLPALWDILTSAGLECRASERGNTAVLLCRRPR